MADRPEGIAESTLLPEHVRTLSQKVDAYLMESDDDLGEKTDYLYNLGRTIDEKKFTFKDALGEWQDEILYEGVIEQVHRRLGDIDEDDGYRAASDTQRQRELGEVVDAEQELAVADHLAEAWQKAALKYWERAGPAKQEGDEGYEEALQKHQEIISHYRGLVEHGDEEAIHLLMKRADEAHVPGGQLFQTIYRQIKSEEGSLEDVYQTIKGLALQHREQFGQHFAAGVASAYGEHLKKQGEHGDAVTQLHEHQFGDNREISEPDRFRSNADFGQLFQVAYADKDGRMRQEHQSLLQKLGSTPKESDEKGYEPV